jgi:hypothetical protein
MAIATTSAPTSLQLTIPSEDVLSTIEAIVSECGLATNAGANHVLRAVKRAAGIKALRKLLNDEFMKEFIMPLQGSRLGFRTDKDREKGYSLDVVRDCLIECLLQGGHATGNEFNIIAGNTYFTKEFFKRAVGEIEGLTDLEILAGVPQNGQGGALVPYVASWLMHGKPQSIECLKRKLDDGTEIDSRIAVRVNSQMGVDAILGKAERKMLARVYNRATGSEVWEGDADESDAPARRPTNLAALTSKLNGQAGGGATAEATEIDHPGFTADESQVDDAPTNAEQSQDPSEIAHDDEDAFDNLNLKLNDCPNLTAVNDAEKAAIAAGLNEQQVRQMCDARRNEIRESRGK